MHIVPEKEYLPASVIPACIRRKHIVLLPGIRPLPECGKAEVGFIFQGSRLDKYGICEHIHIFTERESLDLGIIRPFQALYDLAILVPHRASVVKHRDTVLCVIIQMPGPQRIVITVLQLHHISPEFSEIEIDLIDQPVARKHRPILDDAHIADSIYNLRVDVPHCGIAQKICIVMEKPGLADHLPYILPVDFQQFR